MKPDPVTLSPEALEVLREVARRPGSGLLAVPRGDIPRLLLEGSSVPASSASFCDAERELLRVHREEIAFALRRAAWIALQASPASRHHVVDRALPDRDGWCDERAARIEWARALRLPHADVDELNAHQLLELCVATGTSVGLDAGRLAVAAHRLVPSDSARITYALHATVHGSPSAALHALRPILRGPASEEVALAAWIDASLAYAKLHDPRRALDCARHAAHLDPSDVRAQANRAWLAAETRAESELAAALRELEAHPIRDAAARAALEAWYREARAQRWVETASLAPILLRALQHASPSVRRLFHDDP